MRQMHFADALTARVKNTSPVCVGLDPVLEKLPDGVQRNETGVRDFCIGIIDATKDIASCIKPQLAYFELLGWEGMRVFWDVCAYAKEQGLIVIADAKRGDIGSTCDAYADAYLHAGSPIDAITVNAYLGSDGVNPFIERCAKNEKGIFVLVKTSNPSSGDLQDLPVGDEAVHEHLAGLVASWAMHQVGSESNFSCIGAVVGATYPEELRYLRTLMPLSPFLIPGYGAQGGIAQDVKHGFMPDGSGAIVNASRSILYASAGTDWRDAAHAAAAAMQTDLQAALHSEIA
jgi:orotidine-5'-phosphate decarboxylase